MEDAIETLTDAEVFEEIEALLARKTGLKARTFTQLVNQTVGATPGLSPKDAARAIKRHLAERRAERAAFLQELREEGRVND